MLAGIGVLWCLPNRPKDAAWMPEDERQFLVDELERERSVKKQASHATWQQLLLVLLLTFVYFCQNVTGYGFGLFMPTIIKSQLAELGFEVTTARAVLAASVVYFVSFIAMILNGRHSDRTGERVWHVAVPLAVLAAGITAMALCQDVPGLPMALMVLVVGATLFTHLPAFWPIPSMFLGSVAAASAIGFVNMIGNLGGSYGMYVFAVDEPKPAQIANDAGKTPAHAAAQADTEKAAVMDASAKGADKKDVGAADENGGQITSAMASIIAMHFFTSPFGLLPALLVILAIGLFGRPPSTTGPPDAARSTARATCLTRDAVVVFAITPPPAAARSFAAKTSSARRWLRIALSLAAVRLARSAPRSVPGHTQGA